MFAAGGPSVSAHRRSLVTATAAGAVLCALWFVPTAKAVPEAPGAAAHAAGAAGAAGSMGAAGGARQSAPAVPSSAQPDAGSPAVTSAPSAQAAPPPAAAAEDGFTSPFALSALGLASAGGFLILRACSRTAQAAKPGAGGDAPR